MKKNRLVLIGFVLSLAAGWGCATRSAYYYGPGTLYATGVSQAAASDKSSLRVARQQAIDEARRSLGARLCAHRMGEEITVHDMLSKNKSACKRIEHLIAKSKVSRERTLQDGRYQVDVGVDLAKVRKILEKR